MTVEQEIKDGIAVYNALSHAIVHRIVVESIKDTMECTDDPKTYKALRKVHNYYCLPEEKLPKSSK